MGLDGVVVLVVGVLAQVCVALLRLRVDLRSFVRAELCGAVFFQEGEVGP